MTKPKSIIWILFSFLVFACTNEDKPIESLQSSEHASKCSFSKLKDVTINKETKNGQEITIKGVIEANVDILKKKFGKLEISVEDNKALNETIETINKRVTYDQKFRSNHDAIVQVLCSLEGDLEKEELEAERKKKLLEYYDEMRIKYFRYLIGEKVSNTEITAERPKKETSIIPQKVEKDKQKKETSIIPQKVEKDKQKKEVKLKSVHVVSNTEMKGTYLKIPKFKDIRINSEYQNIKIPVNTLLDDLYLYDKKGNRWQSTHRNNQLMFSSTNLITTNE